MGSFAREAIDLVVAGPTMRHALARLRTGLADPLSPRFVNWSATFWMGSVLAGASLARGSVGSVAAVRLEASRDACST